MRKWSGTSVPTPSTLQQEGARHSPALSGALLHRGVCVCTHVCVHSPLQHEGGEQGTQQGTVCPQTHCSNEKEPAEEERVATGLAGTVPRTTTVPTPLWS